MNQLHLDMTLVESLDAPDSCVPTEVVPGVGIAAVERTPHLMRLVITRKGNLIISVIVIGALGSVEYFLLTPFQCAVIFHTISIWTFIGTLKLILPASEALTLICLYVATALILPEHHILALLFAKIIQLDIDPRESCEPLSALRFDF